MGTPATSHVDPNFIPVFGESIEMVRKVVLSEKAQPFIVSGSGTLGWDMMVNLIEAGDEVLVINTGYFGDHFAEWYVVSDKVMLIQHMHAGGLIGHCNFLLAWKSMVPRSLTCALLLVDVLPMMRSSKLLLARSTRWSLLPMLIPRKWLKNEKDNLLQDLRAH